MKSMMKRYKNVMIMAVIAVVITSCSQSARKEKANTNTMDNNIIFSKGEKITNNNFTGTAWLNMLVTSDTIYNSNIGLVTFEPGARTNWHYHPGGQILLVTSGKGLYQEKGNAIQIIQKGDVIKCPPNVEHWHGATPKDTMTHIAIGTNTDKGNVVWLEAVTDEEYKK